MKKNLLTIAVLCLPALAQTSVKDSLAKHWKESQTFTLAVANAMPADDYNFKPSPAEMGFGEMMIHIGGANSGACAVAAGLQRPALPPKVAEEVKSKQVEKDVAIEYLTSTFNFCQDAVGSMTPAKLDAMVGPGSRKMTGFEWLWAYFTHTAHHRAQAEVYLRVKGIQPPDYTF